MADKDLRVHLKADDDITPAAKKAKQSLDSIPDTVETKLDVDSSGIDNLAGKLGDLPGMLGEVGGMLTGGAGIAAGVGVAAAAAFDLAQGFAAAATEARVTADLTGATIEDASRLQAVWKTSGADLNDLNDVLLQMNGVLQTSPEKAAQIGVNLSDGADIGSRFVEVIGKIESANLGAAEKAQLMAELFGEEGVRQVAKLTASIDGPLSDALDDVSESQIIDEVEEARARKLTAATKELSRAWADLKMAAGEILLGPTTESINKTLAIKDGLTAIADTDFEGITSGNEDTWGQVTAAMDPAIDNLANYKAQLEDTTPAVDASSAALVAGATSIDGWGSAAADAADTARELADEIEAGVIAATDYAAAIEGMAAAQRAAADAGFAVRDAQRDFNDQLTEWVELTGPESEASMQDLAAAMDETALSAGKVADSQVTLAAEQAAANGQTLDAAGAQKTWNRSMVDSARQASGPLRDAIVNYIAAVNNIPPEKVSEIIANPDYASINAASGAIDRAAHDRDAEIKAQAVNIPPTEGQLTYLARPRTAVITAQMQAARNLVLPPSVSGAAMPMSTGPSTYAAPAAAATYAAPAPIVINVPQQTAPSLTIVTPALGNRFDVDRTITKALRRHQRLNGRRE